jgi:hypothetical protein
VWSRELLVLLGLTGFALSQPLLSVLGDNPLVFTTHDIEGARLLWFVVALTFLPPLALWLLGLAITAIHPRLGRDVHLGTVGILTWLTAVQLTKSNGIAAPLLVGAAALVTAGGLVYAYTHWRGVARWLQCTAVLPFLALGVFLTASSSSGLLHSPDSVAAADDRDLASVVFLVLDEFPTRSILDEDDRIDRVRFPHLAAFAEDATWYRRYTSVAPATQFAVPAMLTGSEPKLERPLWTTYPDSLFSLLAPTHDLTTFEIATELCGFDTCNEAAPGEPRQEDPRLGDLLALTTDIYGERVSVHPNQGARLDSFEEEVSDPPEPAAAGRPPTTVAAPTAQAEVPTVEMATSRPTRMAQFVDALEPNGDRPALSFLHLMLPHQPWIRDVDGTEFATMGTATADLETYPYASDNDRGEWISALSEQRHLLQAQYTDRLIGDLMNELRARDLYDDSLVVVAADHGVSFQADTRVRSLLPDDQNGLGGLAFTPLLVKAPGQVEGRTDDSPVMAIDVLPTIADELGLELPFEVDGLVAGSPEMAARGGERFFYDLIGPSGDVKELRSVRRFDGAALFPSAAERWIGPIEAGDDPLAGLYARLDHGDLVGTRFDDLGAVSAGSASLPGLAELEQPGSGPPLGLVVGHLDDPGDVAVVEEGTLVLSVDGTIVAASPLFDYRDTPASFALLVRPGTLADTNEVRAAVVTAADAVELDLHDG